MLVRASFVLGLGVSGAAQQKLLVLEGDTSIAAMAPVAGLDDVDGDGRPEIVVGMPVLSPEFFGQGVARVISSRDSTVLYEHHGWGEYAHMGRHVWYAGDVDGDGTGDYAVVAQDYFGDPPSAGTLFVFSGSTGLEIARVEGTVPDAPIGEVFAAVGDLNGDGYDDVVASNGSPPVYVFLGPDLTLLRTHHLPGFWYSAAGIGDVDQDGHGDYVLGAPQDSTMGQWSGKAVVYSGFDGSMLHTVHGVQGKSGAFMGDHLGRSTAGVGDWDGDGVPDFAVGAPGGILQDLGEGFVRVYSGADGSVLAHIVRPLPASPYARFGARIAGGQDVNGDGFPDLVVGAPYESSPGTDDYEGSVTAVSGRDHLVIWKVFGSQQLSRMGEHLALVGDLDGNGVADFAIGDVTYDPGGTVIVYAGAPMGSESYCPANPNSTGQGAHIYPEGHLKLRDHRFQVVLTQAVPGQSALLFYGAQVADLPFGDGRMCIAPPHWRLAPPQATGPAGEAAFRLPLSQPPFSAGPGAMLPGSSWSFQVWYRDPASTGAGFNTSDALRVLWAPQ